MSVENETIRVLQTRRSVRHFKSDPVDEAIIREAIDCGRLAPTALNVQPWEFIVARDENIRRRLSEITEHGKFISQAPVCIVVFCKECKYYLEDGCSALVNILNAAWAYGVGTCWVAGDKKPYASQVGELLGVPGEYQLVGLIAMGYPEAPPQSLNKRSLDEVLHWEKF